MDSTQKPDRLLRRNKEGKMCPADGLGMVEVGDMVQIEGQAEKFLVTSVSSDSHGWCMFPQPVIGGDSIRWDALRVLNDSPIRNHPTVALIREMLRAPLCVEGTM